MALLRRFLVCGSVLALAILLMREPPRGEAYIGGPPLSLGMMCYWSTHVCIARVEALDRARGVVIYRKVRDVKGKWPADEMRHVGVTVATSAYFLASASEADALAVVDLIEKAASRRLAMERQLVPVEKHVIDAWIKWYGEALESVGRLVPGESVVLRRTIDAAKKGLGQ